MLKVHGELEYQLAYLSSELQEIFEGAPLPAIELAQAKGGSGAGAGDGEGENGHGEDENGHGEEVDATTGTKRRGLDGGDCPICFMPFEPAELKNGDVVWCRAACGNNVHRMCFEQWAEAKRGGEVKCVYWYVFSQALYLTRRDHADEDGGTVAPSGSATTIPLRRSRPSRRGARSIARGT